MLAVEVTTHTHVYTVQVPPGSRVEHGALFFPCLEARDPEFGPDVVIDEIFLLEEALSGLHSDLSILACRPV